MSAQTRNHQGSMITRVGKRGVLVIPALLRQQVGLEEGTPVVAEARDGGVLIRPLSEPAISPERRRTVLEAANRAYAAQRTDDGASAAEQTDQAAWDSLASELLPSEGWSEDDFVPEE